MYIYINRYVWSTGVKMRVLFQSWIFFRVIIENKGSLAKSSQILRTFVSQCNRYLDLYLGHIKPGEFYKMTIILAYP